LAAVHLGIARGVERVDGEVVSLVAAHVDSTRRCEPRDGRQRITPSVHDPN
jgi:ribosomal protein L6P/L9E